MTICLWDACVLQSLHWYDQLPSNWLELRMVVFASPLLGGQVRPAITLLLVVQGVEGQALQSQIAEVQSTFCGAAAASGPSKLIGQQQEEDGAEDNEQQEDGAAAAAASAQPPAQQQWAVEQLCSLCKLPAATVGDKQAVLRFLALHAFVRLDPQAAAKVSGAPKLGWAGGYQ